jgi:D-alanyl-D-alanine carboxypeptidase/D-alanyl-D-alanine-endopeptidase (penicillin-binding protein 4)
MKGRHCLLILSVLAVAACSPSRFIRQQITDAENEFQDHIGFTLYDPEKRRTIFDHQGNRYFIPASNTKILTLYASLQLLGDSIPGIRYEERGDSMIFWGTGDPSFLYDEVVRSERVLEFLSVQSSKLFFSPDNFQADHFGPGWSWGDYRYAYQVERTPFPIYGNRFHMQRKDTSFVPTPAIFKEEVILAPTRGDENELIRDVNSNDLTYVAGLKDTSSHWEIPFHYTPEYFTRLLSDTLKRTVQLISAKPSPASIVHYSVPSDSLYRVMMQESDNFIAEQLLLMCAGVLSDTLESDIAIREVKKRFLSDLPDQPVWVDGSGLSRMNLNTPRSIVRLWEKMSVLVPKERLFALVAVGGVSGTLKGNYKAEKPYVYGKTGTLRNNHMLSGFLVTQSGRILIFSWMNNNFTKSSAEVRKRMEIILKSIYEKY